MAGIPGVGGWNIFQIFDGLVANLLLPVNALLISLFTGWVLSRRVAEEELGLSGAPFLAWQFSVRFLAPLAITAIVLSGFFVK